MPLVDEFKIFNATGRPERFPCPQTRRITSGSGVDG
jgi:hypothetical protein